MFKKSGWCAGLGGADGRRGPGGECCTHSATFMKRGQLRETKIMWISVSEPSSSLQLCTAPLL